MLICMHIIVSQLIILVLQSQINTSELSCVVCGAFYIYQFTVERFQMIPNDLGVLIDFTREANGGQLQHITNLLNIVASAKTNQPSLASKIICNT